MASKILRFFGKVLNDTENEFIDSARFLFLEILNFY